MTLKLRYNPMSPYIRKVTTMIIETGLDDKVERVLTHPWTENTDISEVNPLGKVRPWSWRTGQAFTTVWSSATTSIPSMTVQR